MGAEWGGVSPKLPSSCRFVNALTAFEGDTLPHKRRLLAQMRSVRETSRAVSDGRSHRVSDFRMIGSDSAPNGKRRIGPLKGTGLGPLRFVVTRTPRVLAKVKSLSGVSPLLLTWNVRASSRKENVPSRSTT